LSLAIIDTGKRDKAFRDARLEAGIRLRLLQQGELLSMPHSRTMPSIGARCHELRIPDRDQTWRVIYRIDSDAIVIVDVFSEKTRQTPAAVIENCKRPLRDYDRIQGL
jgi:phage-related protein